MRLRCRHVLLATALACLLSGGPLAAARVRLRYAPSDATGSMSPAPVEAEPASFRISFFESSRQPRDVTVRPNQVVTFRHPFTGRVVRVPLSLPEGTPRMEYRGNRVVYNYGSDTVQVRFLSDGSVEVAYDSGLFRNW